MGGKRGKEEEWKEPTRSEGGWLPYWFRPSQFMPSCLSGFLFSALALWVTPVL